MKVVKFSFDNENRYKCNQPGINTGEYVSLAEYQELRQLLERWNEIANNGPIGKDSDEDYVIFNDYTNHGTLIQSPELIQLIQNTNEVLK